MRKPSAFLAFLLYLAPAFVGSAIVRGVVYDWSTLDPAEDVVVEINTTPLQRMVAINGSYSFEVPKGSFLLEAKQVNKGKTIASAQEAVVVAEEGVYSIDLIIWPLEGVLPELEVLEAPQLDEANLTAMLEEKPEAPWWLQSLSFAIAVLAGGAVLWALLRRKKKEAEVETEPKAEQPEVEVRVKKVEELPKEELAADEEEALQRISEAGGSIGQKELRKALHVSEAKVSMLLSALEAKGFVKKIKKGRGNLVKLLKTWS